MTGIAGDRPGCGTVRTGSPVNNVFAGAATDARRIARAPTGLNRGCVTRIGLQIRGSVYNESK